MYWVWLNVNGARSFKPPPKIPLLKHILKVLYNAAHDITVDSSVRYQTILGFGGAFTDSAVINIASLSSATQDRLLRWLQSNKLFFKHFPENNAILGLIMVLMGWNTVSVVFPSVELIFRFDLTPTTTHQPMIFISLISDLLQKTWIIRFDKVINCFIALHLSIIE